MGSIPTDNKDACGRIQHPSDRPRRKQRVVAAAEVHVQELGALAQLMLGAAWADGNKAAVEVVAIAEQLKEFVDSASLPEHVSQLMESFEPASFDLAAACAKLRLADDEDRLGVLSLLVRVTGADRVLDPAEEGYLMQVARLLGLDPSRISINPTG